MGREKFGANAYKKDLDDLSPNNPVLLAEMSHHQVLLNTAALKLARLDENSEDENGVIFLRMEGSHELSGVVVPRCKLIAVVAANAIGRVGDSL